MTDTKGTNTKPMEYISRTLQFGARSIALCLGLLASDTEGTESATEASACSVSPASG